MNKYHGENWGAQCLTEALHTVLVPFLVIKKFLIVDRWHMNRTLLKKQCNGKKQKDYIAPNKVVIRTNCFLKATLIANRTFSDKVNGTHIIFH